MEKKTYTKQDDEYKELLKAFATIGEIDRAVIEAALGMEDAKPLLILAQKTKHVKAYTIKEKNDSEKNKMTYLRITEKGLEYAKTISDFRLAEFIDPMCCVMEKKESALRNKKDIRNRSIAYYFWCAEELLPYVGEEKKVNTKEEQDILKVKHKKSDPLKNGKRWFTDIGRAAQDEKGTRYTPSSVVKRAINNGTNNYSHNNGRFLGVIEKDDYWGKRIGVIYDDNGITDPIINPDNPRSKKKRGTKKYEKSNELNTIACYANTKGYRVETKDIDGILFLKSPNSLKVIYETAIKNRRPLGKGVENYYIFEKSPSGINLLKEYLKHSPQSSNKVDRDNYLMTKMFTKGDGEIFSLKDSENVDIAIAKQVEVKKINHLRSCEEHDRICGAICSKESYPYYRALCPNSKLYIVEGNTIYLPDEEE